MVMKKISVLFFLILICWGCKKPSLQTPVAPEEMKENPAPQETTEAAAEKSVQIAGFKTDSQCMSQVGEKGEACVFLKNPVAQKGASFPTLPTAPRPTYLFSSLDLSSVQTLKVLIEGTDNSGFLQNSSIGIFANTFPRVTAKPDGTWKYPFSLDCKSLTECTEDPNHRLGQIMAYFWIMFQIKTVKARTGSVFGEGKGIFVNTFSPQTNFNAFWDPVGNRIVMGVASINLSNLLIRKIEFAHMAEVYLHELGHTYYTYANLRRSNDSSNTHKVCGSGGLCCVDTKGCSAAMNEGLADLQMAFTFFSNPQIGETSVNSVNGFDIFGGVSRNLLTNKNISVSEVFKINQGEIHDMGAPFASALFSVWQVAKQDGHEVEVEQLVQELLPVLEGTDHYNDVLNKITALDEALFQGKYSVRLRLEFSRRGLDQV